MNYSQDIRWQKARQLLLENALDVATMAACLGQDEEKLNAMIGDSPRKAISDALAVQMEQTFSKPQGWMSQQGVGGQEYDLFGA